MAMEKEQKESEGDVPSLLQTILKTEGLDIREKISGVIGKLRSNRSVVFCRSIKYQKLFETKSSQTGVRFVSFRVRLKFDQTFNY
jgi:hypothetical protein